MEVFVLTHKNSTTLDNCLESLVNLGYEPNVTYGYTKEEHFKNYQICYSSFRDKILPRAMDVDKDLLYVEDDTILNEPIPKMDKDLNFLGYYEIRATGIVGANIVYIKKELFPLLKNEMDKYCSQHLDRYLSKFCERNNIHFGLVEYDWNEVPHISMNTNKVRNHRKVLPQKLVSIV